MFKPLALTRFVFLFASAGKLLAGQLVAHHGQELRLRQEYFFVSASLQDLLRRYFKTHTGAQQLVDKIAIHLNDTHPAIAVPELMRLLVDVHQLPWTLAWRLCTRIFSYTNHTLMPEALETWPVSVMERVLPRHLRIIYDINEMFLDQLRQTYPGDDDLLRRVSLIAEGEVRRVRMAHLSVLASHKVNGVSRLHSQLLTQSVFGDFHRIFPDRFLNCTNGVTPRRWLALSNPALSGLIDRHIGKGWRPRLDELSALRKLTRGLLRIATVESVSASVLPDMLEHFMRSYPGIQVSVTVAGSEAVTQLVREHQAELARHGLDLPVYLGNRNWHPFLADTLREMADAGVQRAAAFVTSADSSVLGAGASLACCVRSPTVAAVATMSEPATTMPAAAYPRPVRVVMKQPSVTQRRVALKC